MYHNLFIHCPIEGHLGCFQVLATMKKVAIKIHVQVFTWTYVFSSSEKISRNVIAELCGKNMFIFVRNCQTVFWSGCTDFSIPTSNEWEFLSFHSLTSIWRVLSVLDLGHSDRCIVYLIVLIRNSLLTCGVSVHILIFYLYIFFGEVSDKVFGPF